jgi:hypothetical protein
MMARKTQLVWWLEVAALVFVFSGASLQVRAQTARPDDPAPPKKNNNNNRKGKTTGGSRSDSNTVREVKPKFASIKLVVVPADSVVWIDDHQIDKVNPRTGTFELTIEPGSHRALVTHPGYNDQFLTFNLTPGDNDLGIIKLELRFGRLNIAPDVSNAEITIETADRSQTVGTYTGAVNDLPLTEGVYNVIVSRSGYQTKALEVTIRANETFRFDPKLEPIKKKEAAAPVRSNFRVPVRSSVRMEGKFLIVELEGASGDSLATLGSINFTLSDPAAAVGQVEGILSGGPCNVEFIRLENVADGSFVETPGPTNRWARLVLRIRPKNAKRPVQFAINWKAVRTPFQKDE